MRRFASSAAVVHARRQFVDQQPIADDKALHRHHADVVQLVQDRRQHLLGLLLQRRVGLRQRHAGAQDAVFMQVVGQRVEYRTAVVARAPTSDTSPEKLMPCSTMHSP